MGNFNDILEEPLPSHTPLFVECVENDYGSIRVYYEKASDLYTLYIEKSHQTPEEKKKQQELLKKLNYDPKTKTIEVDGHRTRFNIDRENPDEAYSAQSTLTKKEMKKIHNSLNNADSTKKKLDIIKDKDMAQLKKKAFIRNTKNYKNGVTKRDYSGTRSHGVTVGKKSLDEGSILHEVGHVRYASNQRRAEAEPSYVAKYGTKELSKDVRRARLELNKLKKKENPTFTEKKKIEKLEKIVQKGIESTPSYKKDEGQQKRDAMKKMDEELKKKLKKRNLNSHDKEISEYYADAYAIKHASTHGEDMFKSIKKSYDDDIKRTKTKTHLNNNKASLKQIGKYYNKYSKFPVTNKDIDNAVDSKLGTVVAKGVGAVDRHKLRKHKKSTKEREKIAKDAYKKYGKTAVESAN